MAHDIELDRTVAIKIPRTASLDVAETEFLLRNARAATLFMPRIVPSGERGDGALSGSDVRARRFVDVTTA